MADRLLVFDVTTIVGVYVLDPDYSCHLMIRNF